MFTVETEVTMNDLEETNETSPVACRSSATRDTRAAVETASTWSHAASWACVQRSPSRRGAPPGAPTAQCLTDPCTDRRARGLDALDQAPRGSLPASSPCQSCHPRWHFQSTSYHSHLHTQLLFSVTGRLRGTVVERWSLTGELSLSCTRPAADGWPLMWVNRPL